MRLVTYVPDNVLTPLIDGAAADNYFMSIGATREDEAVGTLAGAYMGGLRGVAMMQTSGFALIANALASLIVPTRFRRLSRCRSAARWASSTSARSQSPAPCARRSTPSPSRITR